MDLFHNQGYRIQKLSEKLWKQTFFNGIMRFFLEGYFEIALDACINIVGVRLYDLDLYSFGGIVILTSFHQG